MAHITDKVLRYQVFEFDAKKNKHLTDKIFVLDRKEIEKKGGRFESATIVQEFLSQFYTGMINSGHYASYNNDIMDNITIIWRTPEWELVRIKDHEEGK